MKSTKTFNEMCNYTHELLTALGYTYNFYTNAVEYCLGDKDLFIIFISGNDNIWEKDSFDSPWHKVETNKNGEYELSCINQLTDYAKDFVKLYKQTKVDSRKKEIEKDFQDG